MKRPLPGENTFVVARASAPGALVDWAAGRPAVIDAGFEVLASWVPLPDGDEVPLLGVLVGGGLCAVDALGEETETFYRLGRIVSFLRSRAGWMRRAFPERDLDPDRALRVVVLGEDFSPSFVDAVAGLAVSELVLLRVRDLESTDGRRIRLVEREETRMKPMETERADAPNDFSMEEEDFFRRLEEERESLRPRKEAG